MLLLPMIMLLLAADDDASADDYCFYCGYLDTHQHVCKPFTQTA
jgi:hypothetical protein